MNYLVFVNCINIPKKALKWCDKSLIKGMNTFARPVVYVYIQHFQHLIIVSGVCTYNKEDFIILYIIPIPL